jgi:hypothetical protein
MMVQLVRPTPRIWPARIEKFLVKNLVGSVIRIFPIIGKFTEKTCECDKEYALNSSSRISNRDIHGQRSTQRESEKS